MASLVLSKERKGFNRSTIDLFTIIAMIQGSTTELVAKTAKFGHLDFHHVHF